MNSVLNGMNGVRLGSHNDYTIVFTLDNTKKVAVVGHCCNLLGKSVRDARQTSHPAVDGADALVTDWSHGSNIWRIHLCEVLSTLERNVGRRSLLGAG